MELGSYTIKQLVTLANVAEKSERYDDMRQIIHRLVTSKVAEKQMLTLDERNLLSVAYKNVVGAKRRSWRRITQGTFDAMPPEYLEQYQIVIEVELEDICTEAINLLELLSGNNSVAEIKEPEDEIESKVFVLKLLADYHRYLAEFREDMNWKENAEKYYKEAFDLAKQELLETHPTRLGIALNWSVCCYEIMKEEEQACQIAKEAYDSAIEKLDTLSDTMYKDSTLIMQLLRDNLTLWSNIDEDEEKLTGN